MKDGFNTMHKNIITECYADTLLIEMLGFEKPNHQFGINQVLHVISKIKTPKAFGIIDDDKKKTSILFKSFEVMEEAETLQLRKHHTANKYLVLLKPAFEKWIFKQAEDVNIEPEQYGFKSLKGFASQSKNQNVYKNQKVKAFINTLKQKKPAGFIKLRSWILENN